MDQTSLNKLQQLHPKLRDLATKLYNEAVQATPAGVHPYIVETYRSFAESEALYQQGRTTPGDIVTDAKPGESYHNYGLALDFGLIINGTVSYTVDANWEKVVSIFDAAGFNWGGNYPGTFKDYPHLEYQGFGRWETLLPLYNAGTHFIPGTQYLNL
jgi:peptidoglycan L-alanyl-D-glutamate endopeptidase CwlK